MISISSWVIFLSCWFFWSTVCHFEFCLLNILQVYKGLQIQKILFNIIELFSFLGVPSCIWKKNFFFPWGQIHWWAKNFNCKTFQGSLFCVEDRIRKIQVCWEQEEGRHQVINLVFKYLVNSLCKFRGNLLLEDSLRPWFSNSFNRLWSSDLKYFQCANCLNAHILPTFLFQWLLEVVTWSLESSSCLY